MRAHVGGVFRAARTGSDPISGDADRLRAHELRFELGLAILEAIARFEMVEERSNGDARAHEHRCAAKAFWVAVSDILRKP